MGGAAAGPVNQSAASSADHVGQDLSRMVARVDTIVDARDLAFLVNQEADASRVTRLRIVAGAVGHAESAISVAQQRKAEGVLPREGGIVLDRVEARTEDNDPVLYEIILLVAEPAPFGRSAGGVGLRIEPEQHFLPAQTPE